MKALSQIKGFVNYDTQLQDTKMKDKFNKMSIMLYKSMTLKGKVNLTKIVLFIKLNE